MDNPKDTRMIQTRGGVAHIPRAQTGIPIRDYFQNVELPGDLERTQVFTSASGPVLASADPAEWTELHDKQVEGYAEKLKEQIDDKGYYKRSLSHFAGRLSSETGYPKDEMKAMIVSKFDEAYEQDPFEYLQQVRAEKGLPTRDQTQEHSQEPEM